MSFVALFNSTLRLAEVIELGQRPLAVIGRSRPVVELARARGIPALHVDELFTAGERTAIQDHVDDLTRVLAGDELPSSDDYGLWGWWALEWILNLTLSHGARTRRMLEAGLALAPAADGVMHDSEGMTQGGILSLAAGALGLDTIGLTPAPREVIHPAQDARVCPLDRVLVRVRWQGRATSFDPRPAIVVMETNEIAQSLARLQEEGARHLRVAMDDRAPWRALDGARGPDLTVGAEPGPDTAPLVEARWPAAVSGAERWEREIAELLFVTWQPHLRETAAWAHAAYGSGGIAALLGGGDVLPEMRCRLLACRRLEIPTVLMQHGLLAGRSPERGERIHMFGDHALVWSRLAARDLKRWGCRAAMRVVGWPQAEGRQRTVRSTSPGRSSRAPWLVITTGTWSDNAEVGYDEGEDFLRGALGAIRSVHPDAPLIIKAHPFHDDVELLGRFCAGLGHGAITVVTGLDAWQALEGIGGVVSSRSTAVFSAVALGIPAIVYHPGRDAAWLDRFREIPVARTRPELETALQGGLSPLGDDPVLAYARTDARSSSRLLASLRSIARRCPAPRP